MRPTRLTLGELTLYTFAHLKFILNLIHAHVLHLTGFFSSQHLISVSGRKEKIPMVVMVLNGEKGGVEMKKLCGQGTGAWYPLWTAVRLAVYLGDSVTYFFLRQLALENGVPITDPAFYSSPMRCPDSIIEEVFRAAPHCKECIPLLKERIAIMREVGFILCHVST